MRTDYKKKGLGISKDREGKNIHVCDVVLRFTVKISGESEKHQKKSGKKKPNTYPNTSKTNSYNEELM